jgi:hypothetical protein
MDTVVVACKLPHGMHLEVRNPAGMVEKRVTINGARLKTSATGRELNTHETTDDFGKGYGLTFNVPADFWARWSKENADYPPFARGFIFAQDNPVEAKAQAREMSDLQTGFEPLSQSKLPGGLSKFDPKN